MELTFTKFDDYIGEIILTSLSNGQHTIRVTAKENIDTFVYKIGLCPKQCIINNHCL